jgi:hypothetical protein
MLSLTVIGQTTLILFCVLATTGGFAGPLFSRLGQSITGRFQ